jgi:hypothetical protein
MRQYSHFFSVLYDEPGPVGNLGRGTHHSVIRIFSRHPPGRITGNFNDVAIIWDEDHDTRVITAIELMIMNGSFVYDILFIGERKGMLSIIVREMHLSILAKVQDRLDAFANDFEDPWEVSIKCLSNTDHSIINCGQDRINAYLHGIDALWSLGNKSAYITLRERMRRGNTHKARSVDNDNFVAATMDPLSL